MHLPFSLFLALKYLKPKRTFISAVTAISVLGVILGVAVLVIVLSVMSGFDEMWREKILSFNSHITIEGRGPIEDPHPLLERVREVPGVAAAAPYVQNLVFLQYEGQVATPLVRGVDPDLERQVSRIPEHLRLGEFSVEDGEAVVGMDLARQLGIGVGDTVLLYSPQGFADPDVIYLPEEVVITGIFELGMWEFDIGFVVTSLQTARDLTRMEAGVSAIQVMTHDPLRAQIAARALRERLGPEYLVRTWEEMNRTLFAALRVEKNLMFMLLLCITLVAAFSITNTLITMTVQKTREIGLLKAVGFRPCSIMQVFIWQGWIQGVLGAAAGVGLGLLALRHRNDLMRVLNRRLQYELLPKDLYHLNEIPAVTSLSDVVLVVVCVLVICTLAGLIPALRAAWLDPARALRYE